MYALVIPVNSKSDLMVEFLSICRRDVMPNLREKPGFEGGVVLSALAANAAFIVTLWDSEAALESAEKHSRHIVTSALGARVTQDPPFEQFEVLVQAGEQNEALFARVITLPVPAQHLSAALNVYEGEYLPLLTAQPGFVRVMWLANRTDGSGWGISFWSSREQMQAADREGEFFPKVLARLAGYFSVPPEMDYFAVAIQT